MRVPYIAPREIDFDGVFSGRARGGGLADIRVYNARGGGLFSFIGKLAKSALPILRSFVLPQIGDLARDIAHDVSAGTSVKQSVKKI